MLAAESAGGSVCRHREEVKTELETLIYYFEREKYAIKKEDFAGFQFDFVAYASASLGNKLWVPVKVLLSLDEISAAEWQTNIKQIIDKTRPGLFTPCKSFILCLLSEKVSPPLAYSLGKSNENWHYVIVADISHREIYEGKYRWNDYLFIRQEREVIKKILYKFFPYDRESGQQSSGSICPRCGKPTYEIVDRYSDVLPPPPGTSWVPIPRQFVEWKCSFCGHSDRERVK